MKKILIVALLFGFTEGILKGQNVSEVKIAVLIRNMEIAWANKDAKLFSENFSEEHDFIVWNGMYSPSITPEANKNGHEILFTQLDQKNTKIKYVVDKIHYLSENAALVHVLACIYKKNSQPSQYPTQIQTWILTNENESWKIKSLHSTDIEYDIFIRDEACPDIPSTDEQKTAYAKEFYKSYYSSQQP